MTNQRLSPTSQRLVRRAARVLALLPAIAVTSLTATAVAAPPETWEDTPPVPPIDVWLVIVIIPAALFLLIWLLVFLPSMRRSESYRPGQVWRGEPEWFGGPRKGLDAVDETPAAIGSAHGDQGEPGRGGASGQW